MSCTSLNKDRGLSQEIKETRQDYYAHLKEICIKDEVYDGLRNAFQYVACPYDQKTLNYQLELNKMFFLWDEATYAEKRRDLDKSVSRETQVFLSFYTPDTKLDDLSAKNSNWRAFLDVNGRRYMASIQKMNNRYEDLKVLYPSHSTWSTAYVLTFPVALNSIEIRQAELTITGRVGFSKVKLP